MNKILLSFIIINLIATLVLYRLNQGFTSSDQHVDIVTYYLDTSAFNFSRTVDADTAVLKLANAQNQTVELELGHLFESHVSFLWQGFSEVEDNQLIPTAECPYLAVVLSLEQDEQTPTINTRRQDTETPAHPIRDVQCAPTLPSKEELVSLYAIE